MTNQEKISTEDYLKVVLETGDKDVTLQKVNKVNTILKNHNTIVNELIYKVFAYAYISSESVFKVLKYLLDYEQERSIAEYKKYAITLTREEHIELVSKSIGMLEAKFTEPIPKIEPSGQQWTLIKEMYLKNRSFVEKELIYRR